MLALRTNEDWNILRNADLSKLRSATCTTWLFAVAFELWSKLTFNQSRWDSWALTSCARRRLRLDSDWIGLDWIGLNCNCNSNCSSRLSVVCVCVCFLRVSLCFVKRLCFACWPTKRFRPKVSLLLIQLLFPCLFVCLYVCSLALINMDELKLAS